jgi:hypothetical protein
MLRRVALVRTDVSEKLSASIIRVKTISELETTLAVSSNSKQLLLVAANLVPSSLILLILIMGAILHPKRLFLQQPHGATSQKSAFFIIGAVETSNLTEH